VARFYWPLWVGLAHEQADLQVRVLGLFTIARIQGGDQIAKGQIVRYLAELPWKPDALVANRMLVWQVVDNDTLTVSFGSGGSRGEVHLTLGADGLIASVSALRRARRVAKWSSVHGEAASPTIVGIRGD